MVSVLIGNVCLVLISKNVYSFHQRHVKDEFSGNAMSSTDSMDFLSLYSVYCVQKMILPIMNLWSHLWSIIIVDFQVLRDSCWNNILKSILYKADPDTELQNKRSPNLQKKWFLYQNSMYELKTHFWQLRGCWFQIWQKLFKSLIQKHRRKACSPILTFSFTHEILRLDKFDGPYLKYDKIFLKFHPKNI